ncbi:hypothetical protein [Helicobacter rodentium]|nr:hypothetical protein [Helicobacter rodentium]
MLTQMHSTIPCGILQWCVSSSVVARFCVSRIVAIYNLAKSKSNKGILQE